MVINKTNRSIKLCTFLSDFLLLFIEFLVLLMILGGSKTFAYIIINFKTVILEK